MAYIDEDGNIVSKTTKENDIDFPEKDPNSELSQSATQH